MCPVLASWAVVVWGLMLGYQEVSTYSFPGLRQVKLVLMSPLFSPLPPFRLKYHQQTRSEFWREGHHRKLQAPNPMYLFCSTCTSFSWSLPSVSCALVVFGQGSRSWRRTQQVIWRNPVRQCRPQAVTCLFYEFCREMQQVGLVSQLVDLQIRTKAI